MTTCARCTRPATWLAQGGTPRGANVSEPLCERHAAHAEKWRQTWQVRPGGGLYMVEWVEPLELPLHDRVGEGL